MPDANHHYHSNGPDWTGMENIAIFSKVWKISDIFDIYRIFSIFSFCTIGLGDVD